MSRVNKKLEKRRLFLLTKKKTGIHKKYGLISLGLKGIGPRRVAKMAMPADSRRP